MSATIKDDCHKLELRIKSLLDTQAALNTMNQTLETDIFLLETELREIRESLAPKKVNYQPAPTEESTP
jgi:hypothetical protein